MLVLSRDTKARGYQKPITEVQLPAEPNHKPLQQNSLVIRPIPSEVYRKTHHTRAKSGWDTATSGVSMTKPVNKGYLLSGCADFRLHNPSNCSRKSLYSCHKEIHCGSRLMTTRDFKGRVRIMCFLFMPKWKHRHFVESL